MHLVKLDAPTMKSEDRLHEIGEMHRHMRSVLGVDAELFGRQREAMAAARREVLEVGR